MYVDIVNIMDRYPDEVIKLIDNGFCPDKIEKLAKLVDDYWIREQQKINLEFVKIEERNCVVYVNGGRDTLENLRNGIHNASASPFIDGVVESDGKEYWYTGPNPWSHYDMEEDIDREELTYDVYGEY